MVEMASGTDPAAIAMAGALSPRSTIAQAYARDPRAAILQAMMKSGSSTAPVSSPLEGLSRVGQALLAGWQSGNLQDEYKARGARATKELTSAMDAGSSGGYDAIAKALLSTGNPDTADFAQQFAIKAIEQKAKRSDKEFDLTADLKKSGLAVNPDGSISAIPGFGAAKGEIAGAESRGKKLVDLEFDPQIAAATETAKNPALIARAGGIRGAENASDVQYAAPKAYATETGKTTADLRDVTFNGPGGPMTMPANQAKAYATEAGRNQAPGGTRQFDQVGKLRDDFNALPPVKNFREVVPIYQSMQDAAKRDSKAADLNLVYGLAKMLDPGSVVREGEMIMVNNTSSLSDKLIGLINSVNGGQRLQPETRAALMTEAGSRYNALQGQHDQMATEFRDMAGRYGLNPDDVTRGLVQPPAASPQGQGSPPAAGGKAPDLSGMSDDDILAMLKKAGKL